MFFSVCALLLREGCACFGTSCRWRFPLIERGIEEQVCLVYRFVERFQFIDSPVCSGRVPWWVDKSYKPLYHQEEDETWNMEIGSRGHNVLRLSLGWHGFLKICCNESNKCGTKGKCYMYLFSKKYRCLGTSFIVVWIPWIGGIMFFPNNLLVNLLMFLADALHSKSWTDKVRASEHCVCISIGRLLGTALYTVMRVKHE